MLLMLFRKIKLLAEGAINEGLYVLRFRMRRKPKVMSAVQTLNLIKGKGLSIARYGDGELMTMANRGGIHFQKSSDGIRKDLCRSFSTRNPKLLVCINDAFNPEYKRTKQARRWFVSLFAKNYQILRRYLDFEYLYGNACISRFYFDYRLTKPIDQMNEELRLWKDLWDGRDILLIEGSGSKTGAMSDLLSNSKSIRRIICPDRNAYESITVIKEQALMHYRVNDLVLLSLGPTASILATAFTVERGWQCLDCGHIEVEYLWFKKQAVEKTRIKNMTVSEANNSGTEISLPFDEDLYNKQIVCVIEN